MKWNSLTHTDFPEFSSVLNLLSRKEKQKTSQKHLRMNLSCYNTRTRSGNSPQTEFSTPQNCPCSSLITQLYFLPLSWRVLTNYILLISHFTLPFYFFLSSYINFPYLLFWAIPLLTRSILNHIPNTRGFMWIGNVYVPTS